MGKDKRRMAQNRARKKARTEARRKQRRRQQARSVTGRSAFTGCSRAELARAPLHKTLIQANLFEAGMGQAVVSRTLPDGRLAVSIFLIDLYCLGVKNAMSTILSPAEFQETIENDSHFRMEARPAPYVRKLIKDAIAYASHLGFEPHRDYDDASLLLGDINPAECAETFTFGKDGKPLYTTGPDDSEQRQRQILASLKASCGEDGFHYIIGDPFNEDENEDDEDDDDLFSEDDVIDIQDVESQDENPPPPEAPSVSPPKSTLDRLRGLFNRDK